MSRSTYLVQFSRQSRFALELWTEEYASLADARIAAESTVDDRDADSAALSVNHVVTEEYTRLGWDVFHVA